MALQEEFERDGNWLFRWRSYLPISLVLLLMFSMMHFKYLGNSETGDVAWEAICFCVSFLGLFIRAFTIGHTPHNTSGRNTKKQVAEKLNTSGIYSIVRHPLYLGNFFMMLGVVMFGHHLWSISVFIPLYWLYYERIMFAEEAFLKGKFGDDYIAWANRTPAIIPRFKQYERSPLPFSFKNVLRREYSGFFAVIASMFILEEYGDWRAKGYVEFDFYWMLILITGFVLWFSLRYLKKKTKWLDVIGR